MTGLEKANYIEKIADEFNSLIGRKPTNLKHSARTENEVTLREMLDHNKVNVDKVVKIIYPRN